MKMMKLYMPTLREAPADADTISHQLLLRSGMIRKMAPGIYSYLPMGKRVLAKIEKILREEIETCGSQEVLLPAIQPGELWQESGRWTKLGPDLFRLKDRNGRNFCMGAGYEEAFTDLIRYEVKSYKQLPLKLYQIQSNYWDDKRPRFGVLGAREFLVQDAYALDKDSQGMQEACASMKEACQKALDRLLIQYRIAQENTGSGDSYEFVAMSQTGESKVLHCESCNYAATEEKAIYAGCAPVKDEQEEAIEKVYTPDAGTIEELENFLGVSSDNFAKTLLLLVNTTVIAVMLPGDKDLNMAKLMKYIGASEHEIFMADEGTVQCVTGARVGFAGPVDFKEKVRIILDSRVADMKNMIVGANESDYHLKNVNYPRDFQGEVVEDLVLVEEGDPCPRCGKALCIDRGIQVGSVSQLGTDYADPLHATYLDENGKEQKLWMTSQEIAISRTMAAIVEQHHDDAGILWPLAIAPYQVLIIIVSLRSEEQLALGEELYSNLKKAGIEVLMDDRNERPGVKFNDADLIGIPIRINVGRKASERIVEFSLRKDRIAKEISVEELPTLLQEALKE